MHCRALARLVRAAYAGNRRPPAELDWEKEKYQIIDTALAMAERVQRREYLTEELLGLAPKSAAAARGTIRLMSRSRAYVLSWEVLSDDACVRCGTVFSAKGSSVRRKDYVPK